MKDNDAVRPDAAMLRAVEILANLAVKNRENPVVAPPPIDMPVVLFNERRVMQVGLTTRSEVRRDLGVGEAYPAAGWWTYSLRFAGSSRFLSVIFRDDVLTGAELYIPKGKGTPALTPNDWGDFRLVPGQIAIGASLATLDARYTPAVGGPEP